jgi:repressor LexA
MVDMFAEKLKSLREKRRMSQVALARALGVAQGTVGNWESGIREPNFAMTARIAEFFDVTVGYLLGREGEAPTWADLQVKHKNILTLQTQRIELIGEIACGQPIVAQQDTFECYVECGAEIRADFALRCRGDSMKGARIMDGDIVFIQAREVVDNGEIACVIIEDEATLKRVYISGDTITLVADNPEYPPMVYRAEEHRHITVLGKAVAFQSDIR